MRRGWAAGDRGPVRRRRGRPRGLIVQLALLEDDGPRLLPAARALGAAARPSRRPPRRAGRGAAGRRRTRRAGPRRARRAARRYLLELETERRPRGARGSASPGRRSSSTGSRCSRAPASLASPHRVTAAYLELAVLIRALEGLASAVGFDASPDPGSLWAGLFDLRENLLAPGPGRPARPRRLSRPGDGRPRRAHRGRVDQHRLRRADGAAAAAGRDGRRAPVQPAPGRQGREPGGRGRPARRPRQADRRRRRRRPRRGGARRPPRRRRRARAGAAGADRGGADLRRRGRRERDRRLPGRERVGLAPRAVEGVGPLPARGPRRGRATPRPSSASFFALNAAPGAPDRPRARTCSSSTGSSTRW